MGFDTIEINLVLPHFLVRQLSVWQKMAILEDDLKNENYPKNELLCNVIKVIHLVSRSWAGPG